MRDATRTGREDGASEHGGRSRSHPGQDEGRRGGRLSGNKAVEAARGYLEELTGKECESVSGLSRVQDGWLVTLEVVELERVPSSTDLLASYHVEVNNEGELMNYERVHRYYRNQPGCGE